MGLLDEAIREHLALKRGRGADPAEIAREEKEALGPPTRSEAPEADRAREERSESEDAAVDEPVTALAPADDASRAGHGPGEPRLRLAAEPPERDEPRPAPEGRGASTAAESPPAEPRLRITEEEVLRERTPGAGTPPAPPAEEEVPRERTPGAGTPPAPPAEEVPPEPADDEPLTEDFVFGDEDEDFFLDELDEPRGGEGIAGEPLPEPPASFSPEPPLAPPPPPPSEPPHEPPSELAEPEPPSELAEPEPHGGPLDDDPPLDQPTQQYALEDVEDATRPPEPPAPGSGEEEEPEGEDLLEETPEFLEETPEHDRLWFEQKPPRDFDF